MSLQPKILPIALLVFGLYLLPADVSGQGYKDLVGYTDLVAEKGAALEDGTGVLVMQPEAPNGAGDYLANKNDSRFDGKTITDGTGTNSADGFSSHANGVGSTFYGNTGMAAGIENITGYDANDYIGRILGYDSGGDPLAQAFDVGNHSYIGTNLTTADTINIGQRFDFVINRDNTLMVVGTGNGSGGSTPDLLSTSYNAITVGRTDGNHSRGATKKYGPGRIKPDIVAPASTTSGATPIVGAAAAILSEAGAGTNFAQNQVIKSTLFAGATKYEFPEWDRNSTRPIDDVFGFGELNIYNSYHIFEGGEFEASLSEPGSNIGDMGWDYGSFNGTDDLFYNFDIPVGQLETELSAALVWNIDVIDSDSSEAVFDASTVLANLDLELYDSSGSFLGSLVDSSLSELYNYEHIYIEDLAAGSYTFKISGDLAVDYGFSWRINPVPEPGSFALVGFAMLGLAARRRRASNR